MKHSFEKQYLCEAAQFEFPKTRMAGHVEWEAPANIALVKYWGKIPVQLPLNPSLSFTLNECVTRIAADYIYDKKTDFSLEYRFQGEPNPAFESRIKEYIKQIVVYLPFLPNTRLIIHSENSFPHSAGIASSASFYAALALSLCNIENEIKGQTQQAKAYYTKASFLARLGSGSACRSVYGGIVLWGNIPEMERSSDEVAIPIESGAHPAFDNFRDSILKVHTNPKAISSSKGHQLMNNHPYAKGRCEQAKKNLNDILKVLNNGELYEFIEIIENEALSLHALMLSSSPGYILMKPASLSIIQSIRNFRTISGLPVGFTLDAGANVHVLYPAGYEDVIRTFIIDKLSVYCENTSDFVIHDYLGKGPVSVE